jgi:hypothetical protein
LFGGTLAASPHGTAATLAFLHRIQVPDDPKTDVVVAIVRIPVVAVRRAAILWIVVPGPAAKNKE